MNIADILGLGPKPPPTIDAARVTTHQLPDDGGETEENDMSNHSDVQKAVADCGGRATREEIGTATGFEGKELENAIYNAIKNRRDGKDFVLAKPGSSGTSEAAPVKKATAMTVQCYVLRDGSALIIDGDEFIQLTPAQYQAALNAKGKKA